jgi:glycosyltransferase involved in cell wall biosynthesis
MLRTQPRAVLVRGRRALGRVARLADTELGRVRYRRSRADLALFHEFSPPPSGGGHQFLRALLGELERRGLSVEVNRISGGTPVCLFNSFNFDFRRLRRLVRDDCRMVHRVDGPIGLYRGFDDGTDARIGEINHEFADATVVQSRFSLESHAALGIDLVSPALIVNAVDPGIFGPPADREALAARRVRLITASWSDNANKGGDVLHWLDRNLDWERYEMTFVGRTEERYERIRVIGPIASEPLADALRRHDVYIAPSLNDPCSNALLEGLACGLPAAYRSSGGHPELVGEGGLPFDGPEGLPKVLDRLVVELEERRAAIRIPSIGATADRYLDVLKPG